MDSVEQPGLWRPTGLRQHHQLGGGLFTLQVRQNFIDYPRIFYAGNDLDVPGAALAGLDIDPDAAQLNTRLSRCIHVIAT